MKKRYLLILFISLLFPLSVFAENSVTLDENKTIPAGKEAQFITTLKLDNIYNQIVTKIEFDVEITGGKTGKMTVDKTSRTSEWTYKLDNDGTKVVLTPKDTANLEVIGLSTGDQILQITIPVSADSPKEDITVKITNVSIYVPNEEPGEENEPKKEDKLIPKTVGDTKKITVTNLSKNNKLDTLTVSQGELSPSFSPTIYDYEVVVKDTIAKFTISATCLENCSIGGTSKSTYEKSENIARGQNDPIEIVVAAENGDTKVYTISVYRGELLENRADLESISLEGITIDPEFNPTTYNYYVRLPYDKDALVINYVPFDKNATITIEGNENFEIGKEKLVTIKLKSVDEKLEHTYNIYVTKDDETTDIVDKEVIPVEASDDVQPKKGLSKTVIIIIIVSVSLILIGVSAFFIFKNKKDNKLVDETEQNPDLDTVVISHEDDEELLEYTKEFTGLSDVVNEENKTNTKVSDDTKEDKINTKDDYKNL